eukprot:4200962-Pleurochrysis_carterae.AAC.4
MAMHFNAALILTPAGFSSSLGSHRPQSEGAHQHRTCRAYTQGRWHVRRLRAGVSGCLRTIARKGGQLLATTSHA